jgi:hypothetical protein
VPDHGLGNCCLRLSRSPGSTRLCPHKCEVPSHHGLPTSLERTRSETPTFSKPGGLSEWSRRTDGVANIVSNGAGQHADKVFGSHTVAGTRSGDSDQAVGNIQVTSALVGQGKLLLNHFFVSLRKSSLCFDA